MSESLSRVLLVGLLVVLVLVALLTWRAAPPRPSPAKATADSQVRTIARQVAAIETREKVVAETVWAKELMAEKCWRVFEQAWDTVNAATNKLGVLASFPIQEIVCPAFAETQLEAHEIKIFKPGGDESGLAPTQWHDLVTGLERAGWQLLQLELRHVQFDTDAQGKPQQSQAYFSAHLLNTPHGERAILEGPLTVFWQPQTGQASPATVQRIEASRLKAVTRKGEPGFREILAENVRPPDGSFFIDPLILYDLDGDGLSEIVLAAKNLVLHRTPNGQFTSRALCQFPPGLIFTALIADIDGDGVADFLCVKFDGLYLFKGTRGGTFNEAGRLVWSAQPHIRYGQALTCGDIDGDGDLDVWLGQYKLPYDRGQMPTPFYDANDGYPSYLLLNDGHGTFTDATASSGLSPKRWRRVYSASFADFNNDGKLDLVTASDFAGLELFANDGLGHFTNVTSQLLPEWHGFGMAQACADFNQDGRLDLLMIGMNVPVMDRLQHFGCTRPGFESYLAAGQAATHGNRLCLAQKDGSFQETTLSKSVARTGWSWGCSPFDLDNDGFPDLSIANGHETKQTVQDYETEFWLHDIYAGNSKDDLATFAYFQTKQARTRGQGMSYGGYEKNRLFWNRQGESFLEIGHLMGVALEADSRNVVADDLDGDGRMDLLVTTFEAWPVVKQTLHIFRNELPHTGNWIGFRFKESRPGFSPVGARITLHWDGKVACQQIVAGDSYRSQKAFTAHFGLAGSTRVETVEIQWPNGRSTVLREPRLNVYHTIDLPEAVPVLR